MRFSSRKETLEGRAKITQALREFFDSHGFLEVDTPVALRAPAPEIHIQAPSVTFTTPTGKQTRFLQPSPELPMKRLLAEGFASIFQIAPVFRDGEVTLLHRPEFRMVEWYRANASWTVLMQDCEALLRHCAKSIGLGERFEYQDTTVDLTGSFDKITVDEAFKKYAGFSILEKMDILSLQAELKSQRVHFSTDDSWDDLFHRVYLTKVEPALTQNHRPVFLTEYPAPLASLARLSPNNSSVAERFELFAGGLELANAYGELVDQAEQRSRFLRDRQARKEAGLQDYPFDERFFESLKKMPPSAGIALGFDRLLMLLLDAGNISDVQFLPWDET